MTAPDPLSSLLDRWQPEPTAAPDFAARVKDRLGNTESVATAGLGARVLRFPATLPLAASFAVVLGVLAALSWERQAAIDTMADAYARSIDPLQLTAAGHPPHVHP